MPLRPVVTLQPVSAMQIDPPRFCSVRGLLRRLLVFLFWCVLPSLAIAQDWPQFLGPNRNGSTTVTNLAARWPKEGPPVRWQRAVGAGFAGPVVAAGRLILFHRLGDKETIECLDAKAGKELWRNDYPTHYRDDFGFDEGPRATPAIASDRVYTFGAEGALHCWDFGTGEQRWSVDTKKTFAAPKGFFGMACSPLVEAGAVIVNIGGREGAGIVAFDARTGQVLWKATEDEASYSSPAAASLNGKRVVLVITREALVALRPAAGKILFRYEWRPPMSASVSAATPLVVGDEIFISASYGTGASLLRFKESGLQKIWSTDDALSNHYATSVYRDGFLYGFDGRADPGFQPEPNLRCVEWKTGQVRWGERGLGAGTVTLVNQDLLVLTDKGQLLKAPARPAAFQPTDRAQILPFTVRAHPALADGLFYARSKDKLICVDLRQNP
jgi:outer membrane protein assembly factor BamB